MCHFLPRNLHTFQYLFNNFDARDSFHFAFRSHDNTMLQHRNSSFFDVFRSHEITSTDCGKTFGSIQDGDGSTRRSTEIQKGVFTGVDHDFGNVFQQVLLYNNLFDQGLIVLDFFRRKQGFDVVEFSLVLE